MGGEGGVGGGGEGGGVGGGGGGVPRDGERIYIEQQGPYTAELDGRYKEVCTQGGGYGEGRTMSMGSPITTGTHPRARASNRRLVVIVSPSGHRHSFASSMALWER